MCNEVNKIVCLYIPAAPTVEYDDGCDDIIGQSLMLAHNAVHSSPDQPLESRDPPCQRSHEQPPVCKPIDDHCARSHDQQGSHDQHGSHEQQMNCPESYDGTNKTSCDTLTITSNIPSKITFIDWTEMKRKHVTSSHYPSTPIPTNLTLDQDVTIRAPSSKKKKINTDPTVSICI